jgi:hypothetical protein
MSDCECDCPCCCDHGEERQPTPEEADQARLAAELRLSDRMRPSRNVAEQWARDVAHMEREVSRALEASLFTPAEQTGTLVGLSEWLR